MGIHAIGRTAPPASRVRRRAVVVAGAAISLAAMWLGAHAGRGRPVARAEEEPSTRKPASSKAGSSRAGSSKADSSKADSSKAEVAKALRGLRDSVASRDADATRKAAVAVAAIGGAPAMKDVLALIARIPPSDDALYWALVGGAASFVDGPAMETLGKAVKSAAAKPLARDLVYALADNPSPRCVAALRPILEDGPQDLRILAATKLAKTAVPESVDALIDLLAREETSRKGDPSALAWIAAEGLSAMTGQEFGPLSVNWRGWWAQNRRTPLRVPGEGSLDSGTGTAVDSLRRDRLRRDAFVGLEKADPEAIVVLTAIYTKRLQRDLNNDRMEVVLESMKVPHTAVKREDFPAYDLSKACAVLINCAQFHEFCICPTCKPGGDKNDRLYRCTGCDKHDLFSAKLKDPEVKKLVDFVQRGGFLFGEDWVVKEVLERAFPDFVAAGEKLGKDSVDVVPARGQGTHPYLRGIFSPRPVGAPRAEDLGIVEGEEDGEAAGDPDDAASDDDLDLGGIGRGRTVVVGGDGSTIGSEGVKVEHTWVIDDESFALKVLDASRVVPLLSSGKLQKVANGLGLVGLAFRPGRGKVLPPGQGTAPPGTPGVVVLVLSHFGKQDSTEDEYTIQNLLLNFLIDAYQARAARMGGRKP